VVLEGHFPVGFFDFLFIGLPGHPQDFVIISFVIVVIHDVDSYILRPWILEMDLFSAYPEIRISGWKLFSY
jgi:hypothetical protein